MVQDTNVFVAALRSGSGASRIVLRRLLTGHGLGLMGDKLWLEYQDLLGRESVWAGSRLNPEERRQSLEDMAAACQWVEVVRIWRPNLPDEGDNHIMELAIHGRAAVIVTFNLRDFRGAVFAPAGLEVMKPATFIKAYQ